MKQLQDLLAQYKNLSAQFVNVATIISDLEQLQRTQAQEQYATLEAQIKRYMRLKDAYRESGDKSDITKGTMNTLTMLISDLSEQLEQLPITGLPDGV